MTQSKDRTNQPNFQEQEFSQSGVSRRQFMTFGAAAAAAAFVLPRSAQAKGLSQGGTLIAQAPSTCPPSLTDPSNNSFYQPKVIASNTTGDYCTLSSNLEIVPKTYPADTSTYVRAIREVGDSSTAFQPGPTLLVNPGDKINLNVTNNLPANSGPPQPGESDVGSTYCPPNQGKFPLSNTHNTPGCFNSTNIHFHGLHVSPISLTEDGEPVSAGEDPDVVTSSDDVLYDLGPEGADHDYCLWLPAFHAPGTHWYHAHHHGSTAIQVGGGCVGALIIKEPVDQEICPDAPDVVMLIQEQAQSLSGGGFVGSLTAQEKLDRGIYERTGKTNSGTFLVNGVQTPSLTLEQGEIQRWRMINANSTPRAFINLELRANNADGSPNQNGALQTLYRIAVDGITLYDQPVQQLNQPVPFAPGNRFDFLVDLPPGNYTLWKTINPNLVSGNLAANEPTQALVAITVNDTPFAKAQEVKDCFDNLIAEGIPLTGRPDYLNPITSVDNENHTPVVFQIPNGGATPADRVTTAGRGDFRITNTKYDSATINISADLNSTEEWIIANNGSGAAHPFHIHVNPFLVVAEADITDVTIDLDDTNEEAYQKLTAADVDWNPIDSTVWWDTFAVANNKDYKIRHRFDDYWGTYVLHCHILIHEDQGMMWNVKINDPTNSGANPCEQLLSPVILTGTKIALQADTGKWFSRCNNCQQTIGDNPDTITVHIDDPTNKPYAQFEVVNMGNGKIALRADTGKYVARCRNCIVNGAYPDFVTVHIDDPTDKPYAQFTPVTLPNGKIALKADTGKYVSRCRNCSPGAAYPDQVTIHIDDPTNAPYAQWTIDYL